MTDPLEELEWLKGIYIATCRAYIRAEPNENEIEAFDFIKNNLIELNLIKESLKKWKGLLKKDGINSKKKVLEEIINILEDSNEKL